MNTATHHSKGTAFAAVLLALAFPLAACQPAAKDAAIQPASDTQHSTTVTPAHNGYVPMVPHWSGKIPQNAADSVWRPAVGITRFIDPPALLKTDPFHRAL